ncbi:MAG: thioredoxin domain-containing protein, partial [Gammaproteobacteria bacterium]
MANKLARETSPYLLQHADNPVDWFAWNEEALQRARQKNRPILLSIGYSACHWCHVMAHECFEDVETAKLMNRLFVSIKVDREERPDLDKIYQSAHQLISRSPGGWPLTVFLTADGHLPIFSGT